ncbi:MAG: SDR family oxidoreductase [Rhodothermaceae bacterium]|nr:SDR family oxidoreductase [Rhodothermaceae bacterium]MYF64122.1 SDR family oxidoreductase [Rhodothermaceae bacterium]MYI84809.1 SDR family oxidoreductase [Rhodothermaceae bacterium]
MALTAKHVVVTGGAKGIGGAAVTRFLEEGASVTILDLDEKRARERLINFEDRSLFIRCDVSKADQVKGAFNQIDARFGAVDVLVNNAGIQRYSTVTDTTEEEWDLVMNVNLKSAFLCSKYAIPLMQKRGNGIVINVASVQSYITQRKVAPYTTSKTAMLGLTRSIAVDYAPDIRAVAVCPGTVDTPMLRWAANQSPDPEEVYREVREMHLTQRIAESVEIADLIFYLSRDKASFITGQAIRIDGGLGLVVAGSVRQ